MNRANDNDNAGDDGRLIAMAIATVTSNDEMMMTMPHAA